MSTETIMRHMREVCPFRIGQSVIVAKRCLYAGDWPGIYVVTGLRWEYQAPGGRMNISIASDGEIGRRL